MNEYTRGSRGSMLSLPLPARTLILSRLIYGFLWGCYPKIFTKAKGKHFEANIQRDCEIVSEYFFFSWTSPLQLWRAFVLFF